MASRVLEESETELQRDFVTMYKQTGWIGHHDSDHKNKERVAGKFDWDMYHPIQRRHMKIELKKQRGKLSPAQEDMAKLYTACGIEWHVFRPSDRDSGEMGRQLMGLGKWHRSRVESTVIPDRMTAREAIGRGLV